jgi:myo-inositol 2-dehydrogenase / D-chiro-inositol 1-dehydrogenase
VSERVSLAVVGAGRIGKRHARTAAFEIPGADLLAVCDIDERAARALALDCRCDRWSTDPYAVIADSDVDAVIIASSTDSHAPLIIAAAEAGKHAFCEKPIALDLETTDKALAAVESAGTLLQIGFQRRFDKGYRKAYEMIRNGDLGQIESIRESMRDPGPPPKGYIATSGGLFRDMSIHDFDCVRWLMGEEVESLFAFASNLVDPVFGEFDDVDTSIVSMRFDSGSLGAIDNSRRSGFGYDIRTEIFGSEGALFIGFSRDTPILHLTSSGVTSDHVYWFLERFDDAYVAELQAFVEAIASGASSPVPGSEGRAALALAYAAETSVRDTRPVSPADFSKGSRAG